MHPKKAVSSSLQTAWNYYSANCLLRCAELIEHNMRNMPCDPDETGVIVVDDYGEGVANLDGGGHNGVAPKERRPRSRRHR